MSNEIRLTKEEVEFVAKFLADMSNSTSRVYSVSSAIQEVNERRRERRREICDAMGDSKPGVVAPPKATDPFGRPHGGTLREVALRLAVESRDRHDGPHETVAAAEEFLAFLRGDA